jgi:hypothetical protein
MFSNCITLHVFTDVGIDIRSFDIGADSDVLDLYVELANQDDYREHPEWLTRNRIYPRPKNYCIRYIQRL